MKACAIWRQSEHVHPGPFRGEESGGRHPRPGGRLHHDHEIIASLHALSGRRSASRSPRVLGTDARPGPGRSRRSCRPGCPRSPQDPGRPSCARTLLPGAAADRLPCKTQIAPPDIWGTRGTSHPGVPESLNRVPVSGGRSTFTFAASLTGLSSQTRQPLGTIGGNLGHERTSMSDPGASVPAPPQT